MMNTPVQAPQSASVNLVTARPTANDSMPEPSNSFQQVLAQQVKNKPANDKGSAATHAVSGQGNKTQNAQNANGNQAQDAQDASGKAGKTMAFKDVDALAEDGKSAKLKGNIKDKDQEAAQIQTADASVLAIPAVQTPAVDVEKTTQSVVNNDETVAATDTQPQRGKLDDALSKILSEGKPGANGDKSAASVQDEDGGADLAAWIDRMLPKMKAGNDAASTLSDKAKVETLADARQPVQAQDPAQVLTQVQSSASQVNQLQESSALGSSNTINAYPGRAGWDQAIGQKVIWMAGNGEQSATLNLNPPELGPLQVVIHVHNDQADASFMSNNQEVRQALQDGMDNLRQMMNASGIQLGQTSVGAHTQPQQSFAQAGQGQSDARSGNAADTQDNGLATSAVSSARPVRSGNGLVDTFV